MNETRTKIAMLFRKHTYALNARVKGLHHIFDSEISYLIKYYSKKRKGAPVKKNNKIVVRLSSIKKEIKERILRLYLNRMKFYYTVKTLKWFLLYQTDKQEYEIEQVSINRPV